MADGLYWIWLQQVLGYGNPKVDLVWRTFGSPEALCRMDEGRLRETGLFSPKEIAAFKSTGLERAERNLRAAERLGCRVVTPEHPEYPSGLANIDGIPCVLYVLGDLTGLEERPVLTVVGTRSSNAYGELWAETLSQALAAAGCIVVSGLAVGVDCAAHEGALAGGGRTIGFLACGMDVGYPESSAALKRRILDGGGALVTEFPFREHPHRFSFHVRNRLMSGVASGVVVVQASERSGALITAHHAASQGRDVFAVPGELGDESMAGCNRLISEGAKIVLGAGSILEEYAARFPDTLDPAAALGFAGTPVRRPEGEDRPGPRRIARPEERPSAAAQDPPRLPAPLDLEALGLSDLAREVLLALGPLPMGCDQLVERTGLSATDIMAALTELELGDLTDALPGGRWRLRE